MSLTFSSLLSMIFFNNILIVLIYFLLKDYNFIIKSGRRLLLFCVFVITVRFIFPFEFPFMKTIAFKNSAASFYIFLTTSNIRILQHNITFANLLLAIWIIGILFILIKNIIILKKFLKKIKDLNEVKDPVIINNLQKANSLYRNKAFFRLVYNDCIESPLLFKTTIIIPQILLSDEDWFYVLKHEIAHYYHKDLFYKIFSEILSIIYWWNPFIYLLKKQIANLLEINIDAYVTNSFDDKQKLEYIDCLLKVLKICNHSKNANTLCLLFYNHKESIISQRIHIILAKVQGTKPVFQVFILLFSILIALVTCSFCIIFEPYKISPQNAVSTFKIDNYDLYYMIKNDNGTYDLFCNEKYIATVNEIFDLNIRVYETQEDIPK